LENYLFFTSHRRLFLKIQMRLPLAASRFRNKNSQLPDRQTERHTDRQRER
jgi:hypothetical protein